MTAARVLDVARHELGTAESPPNSNRQKYGRAYGWDGVAWCAIWCWWVLTQAGCGPLIPKSASTVVMRDWYRQRGQWHTSNPRPGDLVFFKFAGNNNPVNHVGIVEAVEPGGSLICIEGNTTSGAAGDQRNGGGVYRKRRLSNIVGFARPAYAVPKPPPPPKPRPREDDAVFVKTQPDKGQPIVLTALLSGPMFVGLGPTEAPSDQQIRDMGATVLWVEYGTWQELDRRSHILCDDARLVEIAQPAP